MSTNSISLGNDLYDRDEHAEVLYMQHQRQERKRNLKKDIQRGFYQYAKLKQKYCNSTDESFTVAELDSILEEVMIEIEEECIIDPKLEVHAYLTSIADLQESVESMAMDAIERGQTRNAIDLIKLLKEFKNDRIAFIKEIGYALRDQNNNTGGDGAGLPEGVSVQSLLAQAKEAREKRLGNGSN